MKKEFIMSSIDAKVPVNRILDYYCPEVVQPWHGPERDRMRRAIQSAIQCIVRHAKAKRAA